MSDETIQGGPLDGMSYKERLRQLLAEEMENPVEWFFMSFADPDLPKGKQFLGGCYLQAKGVASALTRSHELGINPGGEARVRGPLPETAMEGCLPEDRERLLTREEIEAH